MNIQAIEDWLYSNNYAFSEEDRDTYELAEIIYDCLKSSSPTHDELESILARIHEDARMGYL